MNNCIIWNKYKDKDGYGLLNFKGKTMRAHRKAFIDYYGPIPEGLWVLHKCNNPSCVNPEHLYAGTPKQNINDRALAGNNKGWKGPNQIGSNNTNVKLCENDILYIRQHRKYGAGKYLAQQFNTTPSYIRRIWSRAVWKHV